jgi:HPt (histidine-containing phosphotransfer) domain-containing protein
MNDRERMQQQLSEIGSRYLKRTLNELGQLREMLDKVRGGDTARIKDIEHFAHKIYGSGAMFGFEEVSIHAGEIEQLAVQKADAVDPALLEQLDGCVKQLEAATHEAARSRGLSL